MTSLLLSLVLALFPPQQESKPIPKDSVEIDTRGCLKGRVFTATPQPEDETTRKGPDITGRHFRVSGSKDITELIKKYNGQLVRIVGVVTKSSLSDYGTGMKVGKGVTIGVPRGSDPTHPNASASTQTVPVMDVSAISMLADRCPIE
jgi:hypothetical protein